MASATFDEVIGKAIDQTHLILAAEAVQLEIPETFCQAMPLPQTSGFALPSSCVVSVTSIV